MKWIFSFIMLIVYPFCSYAQKLIIDSNAYKLWPSVASPQISDDGKYVFYYIKRGSAFEGYQEKLILQSTNTVFKLELGGASEGSFLPNGKYFVWKKGKDSVGIISLQNLSLVYLDEVASFKLPRKGSNSLLAYKMRGRENELVMFNPENGSKKLIEFVKDYFFSIDGSALIVKTDNENKDVRENLYWVSLNDYNIKLIWQGVKASNFSTDVDGKQLAFIVEDNFDSRLSRKSIWLYKRELDKAECLLNDEKLSHLDSSLILDTKRSFFFSTDALCLFFYVEKKIDLLAKKGGAKVNIWSYLDSKLPSQLQKEGFEGSYLAVVNLSNNNVIRLENINERVSFFNLGGHGINDVALIMKTAAGGDIRENNWNPASQIEWFIVSTRNGTRRKLSDVKGIPYLSFNGKYVVYFNEQQNNFFSYEVSSGVTKNITKRINARWNKYQDDNFDARYSFYPPSYWLKDDRSVILYDQYDIWQVDLTESKPAINITNRFGFKNNIQFRLAFDSENRLIEDDSSYYLLVYNRSTKENGFYKKSKNSALPPERLTMGPYIYHLPEVRIEIQGNPPLKAKTAKAYLVQRMSASESPNYLYTTNFKKFIPISDCYPEKKYNWYKTELLNIKAQSGKVIQGVLFKPENFDSSKKYPLIIYYYEKLSDLLNAYMRPQVSDGRLDIPTFVSQGYIVYTPDVHFKIGETGKSFLNAVSCVTDSLSKLRFINSKKIGIQGVSFGGYATNYLITHTSRFAAACSSAGISDLISGSGSLSSDGTSLQTFYEIGQFRMGANLWKRPELYINNSPIFKANLVNTPLLMMHCTNDGICPFSNAMEFFLALRRLGKKVWLLQYEEGNHGIWGKAADDFSFRIVQFYDHYLKGKPAPKWMTKDIISRYGIQNDFESDDQNKTPVPGLIPYNKNKE